MAKLVGKTYGEALFQLAVETNKLDALYDEARGVLKTVGENPGLKKLLNHPKITREEKISVIEHIFKGNVSDDMTGFLVIIVEKGRDSDLEEIFRYFIAAVMEYKNIGVAYVTTAVPLAGEQKKSVENRLLKVTQYVEFEMHYNVDESIIGGMVIRIGDRVVDSSIRTRLSNMAKELKQIQL